MIPRNVALGISWDFFIGLFRYLIYNDVGIKDAGQITL